MRRRASGTQHDRCVVSRGLAKRSINRGNVFLVDPTIADVVYDADDGHPRMLQIRIMGSRHGIPIPYGDLFPNGIFAREIPPREAFANDRNARCIGAVTIAQRAAFL